MPRRELPNAAIWALEDLWDVVAQIEADVKTIAERDVGRQETRYRAQRALTQLERARVIIAGTRPQVTRGRTRRRVARLAGDGREQ